MDKKAVKILFNTYWTSSGWKNSNQITNSEFEYAKSMGVMFDPISINHDDVISWLTSNMTKTTKQNVAKAFLSSLSKRIPYLRSGLSSFALGKNFPSHNYSFGHEKACTICGLYNFSKSTEVLNVLNFERIKWGGVRHDNPLYAAFDLELLNKEIISEPSPQDIALFNKIIFIISNCGPTDKPNQLEKKLAEVLISNKAERRTLIEILGISGILETKEHKGYFEDFVPSNKRDTKPLHKNDWSYPVVWWNGEAGINSDALNFYFGEYLC
jgi:hypothetical protein